MFSGGDSFLVYPIKVVFIETDYFGNYPAKAAFAVSKKLFKRAVSRNLLKRRMREAYRLNKFFLYEQMRNKKIAVAFIYIAPEIHDYISIETALKKGLKKLLGRIMNQKNH